MNALCIKDYVPYFYAGSVYTYSVIIPHNNVIVYREKIEKRRKHGGVYMHKKSFDDQFNIL